MVSGGRKRCRGESPILDYRKYGIPFSSCKLLICVIKDVMIPIDIALENACGSLDVTALNYFISIVRLVFYMTKVMLRDKEIQYFTLSLDWFFNLKSYVHFENRYIDS